MSSQGMHAVSNLLFGVLFLEIPAGYLSGKGRGGRDTAKYSQIHQGLSFCVLC